jgi:flagellar M-ring protein FliF
VGGFTEAVRNFGIGRLAAILGVAIGVAAVLVAVMLRMGQSPDALLYSNLDLSEASEVTAALDQARIPYAVRGDGSTIMVPRDKVATARLMAAGQGLVTSGSVGYEIFDNQSVLGQTEFQQNIAEQRALQGELARTIMATRGISSARVLIALPRRELFQTAAGEPTASVMVDTGARQLSAGEVAAIRNLVASAVPLMKPERVTVTDQSNRVLASGSEDGGLGSAAAESARAAIEGQLQARIKDIVEGVVGAGAARVVVTADIDQSRSTTQEQRFDPDGQVVRSTSTTGSQRQETTGRLDGGVTAANNIPGAEAPAETPLGSNQTDNVETTNYEISSTTTTTVREPGEVRRLAVSVAIDGVWTPAAEAGGAPTYAPRSEEEIASIRALVAAAAGVNLERGDQIEVVNVAFSQPGVETGGSEAGSPLLDFTKNDIMRGVELLVLLITGLMLIFFVLRPLLKTANRERGVALAGAGGVAVTQLETTLAADGSPVAQLSGPPSEMEQRIDIARIEGQVKASSIRKVADFVDAHPEESTAILRNWLQN